MAARRAVARRLLRSRWRSLGRTLPLALAAAGVAIVGLAPRSRADGPISDNSFLVEEAYNQEKRVVQHISNWTRGRDGGWEFTFTQEWPLGGPRHQLSYTVPVDHVPPDAGGATGISDLSLNYRLQILGVDGGQVAFAPRLSLLLPTGDASRGLGAGGTGVEVNLPLSLTWGTHWVTHSNAGAAWAPNAANGEATHRFRVAQSVVWLAATRVNGLLELFYQREAIRPTAQVDEVLLLSPGIRWAYNLAGGAQVVPGIAVPIGLGPSRGERALYLYLSVEHGF